MPFELFIGLRYLKAKRKQSFISVISFISVLGITVGVTALIIVLSVMSGFEEELRDKILGINANVVVTAFNGGLKDYDTVAREVRSTEGVTGASPFTYNQAMLSSPAGATGAVIRGVDLKTLNQVSVLAGRMKAGSLKALDAPFGDASKGEIPGIIIGSELARNLGLEVGYLINVISPMGTMTPMGQVPRMASFQVAGIFELGMFEFDSSMAFMSVKNAQKFFRLNDTVTGIEVKVADIYKADKVAARITERLHGPYWTRTWMEMNRNLFSALRLEKVAMFIILALIILVAALNIISTLIMVVMEKHKDIAILKSLGATSASIMKIFMIEGVIIGTLGTFLGTALGLAAAINLEGIVSFIERVFRFKVLPPSVYYIDKLPSKVEPSVVLVIVLLSLGISFLATLYPSWKASRLDPVEGLRYE